MRMRPGRGDLCERLSVHRIWPDFLEKCPVSEAVAMHVQSVIL